jgi:hypothetical protein
VLIASEEKLFILNCQTSNHYIKVLSRKSRVPKVLLNEVIYENRNSTIDISGAGSGFERM